MKHTTVIVAIALAAIASATTVWVDLGPARAQQDDGMGMGGGMGMGHGMMGGGENGGMMGRGKGGMMGMIGGGGCPMMGMMMGGDMPMYREGRIAFLKAELAISDDQAKAWDPYADALKKNLQSMRDMRTSMMTAMTGKTPVERLEAHVTAMEGRLQALKDIKPALTALYDSLSDDQKKKANELLTGMGCMM